MLLLLLCTQLWGGACCWLHAALTCCGPCDSHLPPPHPAPLWHSPHRGCSHSQPCCCSAWLLGGGTQPLSAPGRAVCTVCAPLGRLTHLQTDQKGQMRRRSRGGCAADCATAGVRERGGVSQSKQPGTRTETPAACAALKPDLRVQQMEQPVFRRPRPALALFRPWSQGCQQLKK